jgi:hypothetical protein
MGAAPPEAKMIAPKSRVCGLKGIAACLAELAATEADRQLTFSRTTVKRHADKGRLVVKIDGQPTAVLHRDPVNGYWAWKEHLALWMAQNTVSIGASDIRERAG